MTSACLLFVSTRFLFPVDSGGKIRTTQILRGLKGGEFRIVLVAPATKVLVERHAKELDEICDEFHWWSESNRSSLFRYTRLRYLLDPLPIPVRTDRSAAALALVCRALAKSPDVAVFDFAHAAVLSPASLGCPSVMFTHNVEAEIFRRHSERATNPLVQALWSSQYRKMREFERRTLRKFDVVVAVSKRDGENFMAHYGVDEPFVIPTGVDLDFFRYRPPGDSRRVVFCGSMDWLANQDAIRFFMDEIWALVKAAVPDATMTVVGRTPPEGLVEQARRRKFDWQFTGFVDDVRPFVHSSAVSVVPLRVGGGTRLKVYEAMAMGSPIVSTTIGVEGLPVTPGEHYLQADHPVQFAQAIVTLLTNESQRQKLSLGARRFVEQNFSYRVAAGAFGEACNLAISRYRGLIRGSASGVCTG